MFPVTVYDEKTATFRPIFDRTIRAGLVMGIEWSSLSLIEDAPRWVKVGTFIIAVLALAVWESRAWLYGRWKWWFPLLMWPLVLAFVGLWAYGLASVGGPNNVPVVPPALVQPTFPPEQRPGRERQLEELNTLLAQADDITDAINKFESGPIIANPLNLNAIGTALNEISQQTGNVARAIQNNLVQHNYKDLLNDKSWKFPNDMQQAVGDFSVILEGLKTNVEPSFMRMELPENNHLREASENLRNWISSRRSYINRKRDAYSKGRLE